MSERPVFGGDYRKSGIIPEIDADIKITNARFLTPTGERCFPGYESDSDAKRRAIRRTALKRPDNPVSVCDGVRILRENIYNYKPGAMEKIAFTGPSV